MGFCYFPLFGTFFDECFFLYLTVVTLAFCEVCGCKENFSFFCFFLFFLFFFARVGIYIFTSYLHTYMVFYQFVVICLLSNCDLMVVRLS